MDSEVDEMDLDECNCNASVEYQQFIEAFSSCHDINELNDVVELMKERKQSTKILEESMKNGEYTLQITLLNFDFCKIINYFYAMSYINHLTTEFTVGFRGSMRRAPARQPSDASSNPSEAVCFRRNKSQYFSRDVGIL